MYNAGARMGRPRASEVMTVWHWTTSGTGYWLTVQKP